MEDGIQQKSKVSEHTSEACIFCKIIAGTIPCDKVYENEFVLSFIDILPVNKGHVLVIPKKHCRNLFDISEEDLVNVAKALKPISIAVKEAVKAEGVNIGMNNEEAAGQAVWHTHFHIIPRFMDDGLKHWPHKKYEEGERKEFAAKIQACLK